MSASAQVLLLHGEDAEEVASAEVSELFYADGDPTGGHASQNSTLFIDQQAAVFELPGCGSRSIAVAQQTDMLRHGGVTGCVVWNGAVVLARCLQAWAVGAAATPARGRRAARASCAAAPPLLDLRGRHVLELGAGTGAFALATAALGARVAATEQEERLKLLRRNVETNSSGPRFCAGQGRVSDVWPVGDSGGCVTVTELDWFNPASLGDLVAEDRAKAQVGSQDVSAKVAAFDLILATDVVYTEDVTRALVAALAGYAPIPCILCVELRTEVVHFAFIQALVEAGIWKIHRLSPELYPEDVRTRRVVTYVLTVDGPGGSVGDGHLLQTLLSK